MIGIVPFGTFDFCDEKSVIRGQEPAYISRLLMLASAPDLTLKLVEVVSGENCHENFLDKRGEAARHLGFRTDEYDQVLQRAEAPGIEALSPAELNAPERGACSGCLPGYLWPDWNHY